MSSFSRVHVAGAAAVGCVVGAALVIWRKQRSRASDACSSGGGNCCAGGAPRSDDTQSIPGASSLSVRGQDALPPLFGYLSLFLNAIKDIYDSDSNPDGYFALCVAENRLCHKLLAEKLHEAASSSPDVCTLDVTSYGDMSGMERFRVAVVNVLTATCVRKATLDWKHLHITAGLSSSLSTIAVLLCDPGDAVLVPTPTYASFRPDVEVVGQAVFTPFACPAPSFVPTPALLDKAAAEAHAAGHPVRILLLTTPSNPVGTCLSKDDIIAAMQWCTTNRVHCIVDEIYANSEFQLDAAASPAFVSAMDIMAELEESKAPRPGLTKRDLDTYVHVLWGMSKDFAASGMRVGFTYTNNEALLKGLSNTGHTTLPGHYQQQVLAIAFEDLDWVQRYLTACRSAVRQNYNLVVGMLDEAGVAYRKATAGMFVFVDLRPFLSAPTFEAEAALMRRLYANARVVVTPGAACYHEEPGWARVCVAWHTLDDLRVAVTRVLAELKRS